MKLFMKLLQLAVGVVMMCVQQSSYAGVITNWEGTGVDFSSSWLSPTTLRIQIDAANPTGGWAGATNIDAIAINAPDAWNWSSAGDIALSGPGTFGGAIDSTGLNAGGCEPTLSLGGNHPCWSGSAALADNMHFDFTFSDTGLISNYTDNPHLKVRFVDADGRKVGSLLSSDLPSASLIEPSSLAMLAIGVVGLVVARRQTRVRL